jgi:hypothetical protein
VTERVILPIHGHDHCPGGPDPIPCGGTPAAMLGGLDFVGDPSGMLVPADTWQAAAEAAVNRKFHWGWHTPGFYWGDYKHGDTGSLIFDPDNGTINSAHAGLYIAYLRIVFQDNVAGEVIGCGLHFGHASLFFRTTRPVEASGSGSVDITIPIMRLSGIAVRPWVYSSNANQIGAGCELYVLRVNSMSELIYVEWD